MTTLLNPHRFTAGAPAANEVSFVAGAGAVFTASGTSRNLTLPAGIQAGDLIVVYVFARATITPHAGYTHVGTSGTAAGNGRTAIYTKTATSGDANATITFQQASAARMGLAAVVTRGTTATPTVTDHAFSAVLTAKPYPIPVIANVGANHLGLTSHMNEHAASGTTTLTPPANYTGSTTLSGSGIRLAVAHRALPADTGISGSWDTNLSAHSTITSSLLLE